LHQAINQKLFPLVVRGGELVQVVFGHVNVIVLYADVA